MIAERRAVAYEPKLDIGLKDSYLSKQINTFIGERLNVRLSKNNYEIKNGLIYGQDIDEPFINVIKRGVDYRRRVEGEDRVDKRREEAEITGFSKIQEVMCGPQTQVGTMMLSISPKGGKESLYQHNFYDIFTLNELDGKRFVEARRYSSALSIEEYKDKLSPLSFMGNISSDADFLERPVRIENVFFENADQIHSYLHRNHKTIELEKFERIMEDCESLKREYYRTKDPLILDAIMNKADEGAGLIDKTGNEFYSPIIGPNIPLKMFSGVDQEIAYYGGRPVREVKTGCGSSGSLSKNSLEKNSSPFSVSEFDDFGDREFPCPACGHTNRRPYNEKIPLCQNEHCWDPTAVAC